MRFVVLLAVFSLSLCLPLSLTQVGNDTCSNAERLSTDGTAVTGSLGYMGKHNYYVWLPEGQSGDLTIKQSVTGGSDYGVWTFVGRNYLPYDGKSDWDFGTIKAYEESIVVDNLDSGACFYIAVWHLETDNVEYSMTATLVPHAYTKPVELEMDDMPVTTNIKAREYNDFLITPTFSGNISVETYILTSEADSASVYLLTQNSDLPRLGNYAFEAKEDKAGEWKTMEMDFVRKNEPIGISVYSSSSVAAYVRVRCLEVYGGGDCPTATKQA